MLAPQVVTKSPFVFFEHQDSRGELDVKNLALWTESKERTQKVLGALAPEIHDNYLLDSGSTGQSMASRAATSSWMAQA